MGSNSDKVGKNSGATSTGVSITARNMDGRKSNSAPANRGKGAKKK